MNRLGLAATFGLVILLSGCSSQQMLLRTTTTGGNGHSKVKVTPTGQVETGGIGIGDTVAFSPGSMRAVVGSPEVNILLFESGDITQAENKKALSMNRRDGAKIELMKGKLQNGDMFIHQIGIDVNSTDPKKFDIDLVLLAFNRGEKPFRGDITVYDMLPPELQFKSADSPTKYNDRSSVKEGLSVIPFVGLLTLGMDNFSKTGEQVDMQHEQLGEMHKYTFRRLVLEPGQAVGMTVKLRYLPPSAEDLAELRQNARPLTIQVAQ